MNKLNVGDYIRTKDGIIDRIEQIVDNLVKIGNKHDYYYSEYIMQKDISKFDKHILYLIEKGDYINGEKVDMVYSNNEDYYIKGENSSSFEIDIMNELEIKTIVTHEQFSQMQYEVGE